MQIKITSRISWLISMVLSPLIVPPLLFVLAGMAHGQSANVIVRLGLVSGLVYTLLPVVYLAFLLRTGHIQTIEARDHENRKMPLIWGSMCLMSAIPVMMWGWPEHRYISAIISGVFALNALVLAVITMRVKISLHVTAMASLVSVLAALLTFGFLPEMPGAPQTWLVGAVFIALVSWARLDQKAHSTNEVAWGLAYGLVVPWMEIAVVTFVF